MKFVCVLLLCMVAYGYAYFDEADDEVQIISRSTTKKLPGGFTFVTTSKGNGKYDCECFKGGKKVWSGMCGVKDRSFSYSDCV